MASYIIKTMPKEAQTPAPLPQVTTGTQTHDWKKVSLTLLIILVVSGLLVAGYWFLVLNKSSDNSDLTGPVPKVTTKPATESAKEATPSAEKDVTADWKTYKGEVIPMEFKYPGSLTIIEREGNFVEGEKLNSEVKIKGFTDDGSLIFSKNFLGGFGSANHESIESNDIAIDSYQTKQNIGHDKVINPNTYFMIISLDVFGDKYPLIITANFDKNDNEKRDTVEKILSTVKFLD